MSPHVDQFNDEEHEVFIPFDEAGEARYPRRAADEIEGHSQGLNDLMEAAFE